MTEAHKDSCCDAFLGYLQFCYVGYLDQNKNNDGLFNWNFTCELAIELLIYSNLKSV